MISIVAVTVLMTFAIACLFLENGDRRREESDLRRRLRWHDDELKQMQKAIWEIRERAAMVESHLKIEVIKQRAKMVILDKS
jgi:hypothetical protein